MDRLGSSMLAGIEAVTEREPVGRAEARLRATGRAYVEFALAESDLFGVAFACFHGEPDGAVDAPGPPGLLTQVLDEGVAAGAFSPSRRPGAEVLCWSAVPRLRHAARRRPRGRPPAEERQAMLETLLDGISRGLR